MYRRLWTAKTVWPGQRQRLYKRKAGDVEVSEHAEWRMNSMSRSLSLTDSVSWHGLVSGKFLDPLQSKKKRSLVPKVLHLKKKKKILMKRLILKRPSYVFACFCPLITIDMKPVTLQNRTDVFRLILDLPGRCWFPFISITFQIHEKCLRDVPFLFCQSHADAVEEASFFFFFQTFLCATLKFQGHFLENWGSTAQKAFRWRGTSLESKQQEDKEARVLRLKNERYLILSVMECLLI